MRGCYTRKLELLEAQAGCRSSACSCAGHALGILGRNIGSRTEYPPRVDCPVKEYAT
jgi:hypothetical protein